jgi:hypothetical protein
MASEIIYVVLGIFHLLILSAAAYMVYKIYTFNRLSKGWLFVIVGIFLMMIRRLINLFVLSGFVETLPANIHMLERVVLPFFISLFFLMGLFSMYRNFTRFDVVEKKIQNKFAESSKKKRK